MFSIFYPRHPQYPFTFIPQKYGNRPGLPCPICNQYIIHHACVSLCQCRIFTHKKCFLNSFPLKDDYQYYQCKQENNEVNINNGNQNQSNQNNLNLNINIRSDRKGIQKSQSTKNQTQDPSNSNNNTNSKQPSFFQMPIFGILGSLPFFRKSSSQYPQLQQQQNKNKNENKAKEEEQQIEEQKNKKIIIMLKNSNKTLNKKKKYFNAQFSKPICKHCQNQIILQYESTTVLDPHVKPIKNIICSFFWSIILIILIGLVINYIIASNVQSQRQLDQFLEHQERQNAARHNTTTTTTNSFVNNTNNNSYNNENNQDNNIPSNLRNQSQTRLQRFRRSYRGNAKSPLALILYSYSAALCFILLIVFLITVLFKKQFRLTSMRTTQKSLEISAFEGIGIGIGTNMIFEDTNHQMIKKEVTI